MRRRAAGELSAAEAEYWDAVESEIMSQARQAELDDYYRRSRTFAFELGRTPTEKAMEARQRDVDYMVSQLGYPRVVAVFMSGLNPVHDGAGSFNDVVGALAGGTAVPQCSTSNLLGRVRQASPRPTRFIQGVSVTDIRTGRTLTGTVDLQPTLDRISSGVRFPHRNDGTTFYNNQGSLPAQPSGYYREYVHPTPGVSGPGPQRIVAGQAGEMYYTPDHYRTFIPINQ